MDVCPRLHAYVCNMLSDVRYLSYSWGHVTTVAHVIYHIDFVIHGIFIEFRSFLNSLLVVKIETIST